MSPSAHQRAPSPLPQRLYPIESPVVSRVFLDLPEVAGRSALKTTLMSMGIVASNLPAPGRARDAALRRLAESPQDMAFIDISHRGGDPVSKLLNLTARVPWIPVRQRIILTRLVDGPQMGHVSEADRYWVKQLGFHDLVAELDHAHGAGGLHEAICMVTDSLDMEPVSPERLTRYTSALADLRGTTSPRKRLREMCGCSAEALCNEMHHSLEGRTGGLRRRHHKNVFSGSQATSWLSQRFMLRTDQAVEVGRDLMSMGLLAHVHHEKPFLNEDHFYQLTSSKVADRLNPWEAFARLTGPEGPQIEQRNYLHKGYARCWVGHEAVDCLVKWHKVRRFDAWVLLHRLMQFGLIEHITRSRPFIDGRFYYRFTGLPGDVTH